MVILGAPVHARKDLDMLAQAQLGADILQVGPPIARRDPGGRREQPESQPDELPPQRAALAGERVLAAAPLLARQQPAPAAHARERRARRALADTRKIQKRKQARRPDLAAPRQNVIAKKRQYQKLGPRAWLLGRLGVDIVHHNGTDMLHFSLYPF
jgi:hypothetical protein